MLNSYSSSNENTNTMGGNYNWNEAQWKVNSKHNLYLRLESFNI